ncbi:MAG TPA: tRNA lysidine(34) synthetase TilS [Candidatus Aminicenantes bacterium]|nr:tRNA lysidine(34) synthetase TilS [Candidatus Aminicenantes bacterium]
MALLEKVKKTILEYRLITSGDKVLLAYSGGVDSTALLHLLLELRKEMGFGLYLAHFNHQLRPEADEEELFIRERATQLKLSLTVGRANVRQEASRQKLNLEEAARVMRYRFLEETAAKIGATKIATAHNLNDQVETFFLHLFRGTGPRGLWGIRPKVGERLIRPLLEVSRAEIETYLRQNSLPYRVDRTNFDRRWLRNKIRVELIPYLLEEFDASLLHHIKILTKIGQDEEEVLLSLGQEWAEKIIYETQENLCLDRRRLSSLSPGLARLIIREYLRQLRGDLRAFTFRDVETIFHSRPGQTLVLSRQVKLRCEEERIYVLLTESPPSFCYEWEGQNQLEVKEIGIVFEAQTKIKTTLEDLNFDDWQGAYLDSQKVSWPLVVKPRQPGDRYQPLGSPGRKKLKEIFRHRKIPWFLRSQLPVFWSKGEIIWVPGLPVAEKVKIDRATKEVLHLRIIKGNFPSRFQKPGDSTIDDCNSPDLEGGV